LSAKGIASPVSVKVSVQQLVERNEPWMPIVLANLGADEKTRTSTHSVDNDGVVAPAVIKAWDI
jgi:hypothetical protein